MYFFIILFLSVSRAELFMPKKHLQSTAGSLFFLAKDNVTAVKGGTRITITQLLCSTE